MGLGEVSKCEKKFVERGGKEVKMQGTETIM